MKKMTGLKLKDRGERKTVLKQFHNDHKEDKMMNKIATSTNKFWLTLLAAGTLWAGLGLGTALASVDAKEYPASTCRPATRFMFGVDNSISIYNKSTSRALWVYCPIIRDLMARDAKMEYVLVKYYNPYFQSRQVSCQLLKLSPLGKVSRKSKETQGNRKTPGGTIVLKLRGAGLKVRGADNYVVKCKLPHSGGTSENQKVRLSGYSAREKD